MATFDAHLHENTLLAVSYKRENIDPIIDKISINDDENALRDLFELYHGKLLEAARFYVNDDYAAKDVVSEVFIKIWKNRSALHTINNVSSYLFVATKRQSLNYLRDNKRKMHYSLEEAEIDTFVEFNSPENAMINKEFEAVLSNAVQDLPSKCRLVYSMVKDEGMKYSEVAEALNVSAKTVEMHVGKALKRIRLAFLKYKK